MDKYPEKHKTDSRRNVHNSSEIGTIIITILKKKRSLAQRWTANEWQS